MSMEFIISLLVMSLSLVRHVSVCITYTISLLLLIKSTNRHAKSHSVFDNVLSYLTSYLVSRSLQNLSYKSECYYSCILAVRILGIKPLFLLIYFEKTLNSFLLFTYRSLL